MGVYLSLCHVEITYKFYHLKIGPQVLVLGKEAEENGLATSLLVRMHNHYKDLNKEHNQTIDHLTSQFPLIIVMSF